MVDLLNRYLRWWGVRPFRSFVDGVLAALALCMPVLLVGLLYALVTHRVR